MKPYSHQLHHAVTFAQAGLDIPAPGTAHADYFYTAIPSTCSQHWKGYCITIKECKPDPMPVSGIVVKNHGLTLQSGQGHAGFCISCCGDRYEN